jgi:hypothetical protein
MEKFLLTLFLLVIIAGVGLFFGWAQQGVPPDAYGVIQSKTHGIDPQMVKPGEFRWVWYKLIPTNAKTTVFRLAPYTREINMRNTLPSGKTYSAFAEIQDDFSWEINIVVSFSLKPDSIIPLLSANNFGDQEGLTRYEDEVAGQIEAFLLRRLNSTEEYPEQIEDILTRGKSLQTERELQGQFPFIHDFALAVKPVKLPDFALYKQARGVYEEYLAMQKGYIAGDLREAAKDRIDSLLRYDELELYGALFTKYPILIDYLSIERRAPY